MTEFWEPWAPQVGDRVRVIYNPECPHGSWASELADRALGEVSEVDPDDPRGHGYKVQLDHPEILPEKWMGIFGPWCAALELEPVQ